jgi:uncharacterized protein with gpF-like domain
MPPRPPLRATLRRGERLLRPIRPDVGTRAKYRADIEGLIEQMHHAALREITRAYAAHPPATVLAMDATPVQLMKQIMRKLQKDWLARFNAAAPQLAEWFATETHKRSDAKLKKILRDGGISVRFRVSENVKTVMAASVGENVALIRSIPQQYFTSIEQKVMSSAVKGGDLQTLTADLQKTYGVTYNRAKFIARDQNNKLTSAINNAQALDAGAKEGIWYHSHGGHEPRKTHLKFDGHRFDLRKGAYLETTGGKMGWTFPGYEINCRCFFKLVIPGISE